MTDRIPMILALRGYAVPVRADALSAPSKPAKHPRKVRKTLPRPSAWTVVFDTETTTDHTQKLRFGTYQVRKGDALIESGVFYDSDNLILPELQLLGHHVAGLGLKLITREAFVREVLYRYAYDYGGMILGFNLPFDLSRLAIATATSHGKDMRGGFSLTLLPDKWRPNVLVKHLNGRTAFMRFAAAGQADARSMRKKGFKTQTKTGYFLDLKTLGSALLGRSFSLASLAELLGTPHQKIDTDEHGGPLSVEYIDYAINDTQATWECYCELRKRFDAHGLTETPPHRIYSEASLGKAYLRQMGIQPWSKLQPDFPAELLGIIMSTYYGGRAEIRIRRQATRVLYCDFRSMYPTVCTLMGLWSFVTATGIDHQDWTAEATDFLDRVQLADLQRPETWLQLTALVRIEPDDDILPARAHYSENARTIGLNYVSSEQSIWYTLADCVASKLLTGKPPRIVQAIKFTHRECQPGLQTISVGGNHEFQIDPASDDFYKRVIELRGQIQTDEKHAKTEGRHQDAEQLGAYQQMLKLLANSTSYGIFAEMNVQSFDRPRKVVCYGTDDEAFDTGTKAIEEPGTHFHPLLATLITGAARLMLAMAERVASDAGIGWALCDTDSLALARPDGMTDDVFLDRAIGVTGWFDPLSPYGDRKPLFKIEDVNFALGNGRTASGRHQELFAFAVSAKRYCLVNLDAVGRPVIRKALAHGLGHWRRPYEEREAPAQIPAPSTSLSEIGCDRWHYDLWHQIVLAELEGHPDQVDLSMLPNLYRKAASRYSASTPALLHWFDRLNRDKPFSQRVRPFNFLLAYQLSETVLAAKIASGELGSEFLRDLPAPVAPFDNDLEAAACNAFDRNTGRPVPREILATYREALAGYHLKSESKFDNAELTDRGVTGRRHIQVVGVEYIGKEANRWEEKYFLGELDDALVEYGSSPGAVRSALRSIITACQHLGTSVVAGECHISRQQITTITNSKTSLRRRSVCKLMRAITSFVCANEAQS